MIQFVFETAQNIVEKEENNDYSHFLLFPDCFQKALIFNPFPNDKF